MGSFYSSARCSTVLQIKTIPTPPPGYTGEYGSRPYDISGWCIFEESAAQLVAGVEAVIKHHLNLLREPYLMFMALVRPVLLLLFSAVGGGESFGVSGSTIKNKDELAAKELIDSINRITRPKLIDVSDSERPREVKLCAA